MKLQVFVTVDTSGDPVWDVTDTTALEMLDCLRQEFPSLAAFLADILSSPVRWHVGVSIDLGDGNAMGGPMPVWSSADPPPIDVPPGITVALVGRPLRLVD